MFLIVGGDSEIGAAALRAMLTKGFAAAATTRRRELVGPGRPFLDLGADIGSFEPAPRTQAVCICAAIARIATCAADPEGTAFINVDRTLALTDRFLARGIYVLFLSTNQVFDGRAPNVLPGALYSPVSEYGRQKARTETALRERMARGAPVGILRLAKVVSTRMALLDGWVRDLSAGKPINAFCDMTLAPTPTHLVCDAIIALLNNRQSDIFQFTGPRDVSYAAVAHFLATRLGAPPSLVNETSARSAGLPEGATPLNTTLDSRLISERFGLHAPDAWNVIEETVPIGSKKNST
ncbi:MAG TPA: sugar nucleotide-binding protein [Steroidobacteraceae bacterium]|jgi:dTDP-4-dehydrorhamnose reductase